MSEDQYDINDVPPGEDTPADSYLAPAAETPIAPEPSPIEPEPPLVPPTPPQGPTPEGA